MKDDVKVFQYIDHVSRLCLWQKAIFLVPAWGFPALVVVGGLFSLLGDFGLQFGFTLTLGFFASWLAEDILKVKLRIEDGRLFHGFRVFELSTLASVGLEYGSEQMVPRKIVLNFSNGKRYKLKISRLKQSDTETLLKMIETRFPNAKIDPVLRTLSKCKRLAGTTSLDTTDRVEIPYQSRILLKQLRETFVQTSDLWMRAGPALVCLILTGFWLGLFSNTFAMLSQQGYWNTIQKLSLKNQIEDIYGKFATGAADTTGKIGEQLANFLAHPVVALMMLITLALMVTYLIRYFTRPTTLMLDKNGLSLLLRFGNWSMNMETIDWSKLRHAYLKTATNKVDLERATIVFQDADGKSALELNLSSLQNDNRTRLLKAIQRLAPNCTLDTQLSEALMPRQERSYTELWLQSLSAAPERKSLEPLAPGQTLQDGKFEVVRRLGVGGQGQAYLCIDRSEPSTPVEVVLKETILPLYVETIVRQQALERFQQEAELLNQLKSDRIVKLLDHFIEDHRGYLVLEHVDGQTLRQLVEEKGAMPEHQARDLAVQMSEILVYLHEHGIIHRDFTPDNLILKRSGKLTLIDFNVAQTAESGSTGTIVGKHAYVPPEQFRGKPTFASDIYAMGATLHFLVTGKDPEPISESRPAEADPSLTKEFSDVVARCTKIQQDKRVQTAQQAKEAFLNVFAEGSEDNGVKLTVKTKETTAS